ncbi:MAG: heavy metal transporter [Methylotenera sp.]|uniref:Heavy metal transport/detoxification protein n=1 Tax=Methylotenera mobilis (strain JLW8 / ATCC BAA-1282 / DSM 17540) TaxID=583345 RepID=C6WWU4_METML|nr:heavy metal-associated domain-containing protein [Methylotenera mobilis]ACT48393.1 Heavy metal transport/detoxification protein [Methylotenera mobilis JLW8]PPC80882.1 MAG: heavy metal transporter [Methylotenera sp.]PPC96293.1 MAG: heavy metal transporter [Methylotenera sp.]
MYILRVQNMNCGGCVNTIKKTIQQIDALAVIDVELSTKTLRVNSAMPEAVIIQAISDAGFQPLR